MNDKHQISGRLARQDRRGLGLTRKSSKSILMPDPTSSPETVPDTVIIPIMEDVECVAVEDRDDVAGEVGGYTWGWEQK